MTTEMWINVIMFILGAVMAGAFCMSNVSSYRRGWQDGHRKGEWEQMDINLAEDRGRMQAEERHQECSCGGNQDDPQWFKEVAGDEG